MYLYILKNSGSNNYYIGTTNVLARRLREHNGNHSHYTGKIEGKWKLIFRKYYNSGSKARKEELRLKRAKNKKYLDWYILNKVP